MKNKIIKSQFKNKQYIVHHENSIDITELISQKYNYLINTLKINSDNILVLTLNRASALKIKNGIEFTSVASINIYSFLAFIQKELFKYWPIIIENCDKIVSIRSTPVFLTFEASQCLMSKLTSFARNKSELKDIKMSNEEIAQKCLSNLSIMAFSNQNYLNYSKFMKMNEDFNTEDEKTLDEIGKIVSIYVERVLKEGVLDFALSMYLYINYLLKNPTYIKNLKERIKYVIIDSGELMYPCQIDFIENIKDSLEELCIFHNDLGAYGIYSQNRLYIENKILGNYMDLYLEEKPNSKEKFIKNIEENILYGKKNESNFDFLNKNLEYNLNTEVHEKILEDLQTILEKEGSLEGTTILLPSRDISLEFILQKYSLENNIDFKILNRNEKITDNKYINALIIFAQLYYSFDEILINIDELRTFFMIFLDINPIHASIIAEYVDKERDNKNFLVEIKNKKIIERLGNSTVKKYDKIRLFIANKNNVYENISDFFKEIYLKYYLLDSKNKLLIKECRNLIESASNFIESIKNFENIKNENLEFLIFIRNGIKENENIFQIEERVEFKGLILSSPLSYINYGKKSKNLFILDIHNNLWLMNNVNSIQNPFLLSKGWKDGTMFSKGKHEEFRILEINSIIKRIMLSVEKNIYIYGHKYSSLGMKQYSILTEVFM
jgi:hypothetical protein